MVKHQKEKLYVSQQELRASQNEQRTGLGVSASSSPSSSNLPFECCALTLIPFEQPVCNSDGIIFEHHALVEFLLKQRMDPSTGKQMNMRDIIHLNMDRVHTTNIDTASSYSAPSRWQCLVLHKPFTQHSKVVAILQPVEHRKDGANGRAPPLRRTANVYSYEAVQQLNIKPKNFVDLISNQPFDRKRDLIWLFDPSKDDLTRKRNSAMLTAQQQKQATNHSNIQHDNKILHSAAGQRVLDKLQDEEDYESKGKKLKIFHEEEEGNSNVDRKNYLTPSLTSTSSSVTSSTQDIERPKTTEAEVLEEQMIALTEYNTKGYVKLHTTKGTMSFVLDCDIVPKTCINFLGLSAKGAYDKSPFHRLIKNFMMQGGKPKSTKKNDASLWGTGVSFEDEFDNRLKHDQRGILSMANHGSNTNKCQFFILFRPSPHLDRKHTVFGHIIQGLEVLDLLEKVPTNKDDEPLEQLRIDRVEVIQDPTQQAVDAYRAKIEKARKEQADLKARRKASALGQTISFEQEKGGSSDLTSSKASASSGVGKYLAQNLLDRSLLDEESGMKKTKVKFSDDTKTATKVSTDEKDTTNDIFGVPSRIPPPPKQKMKFGDFSAW